MNHHNVERAVFVSDKAQKFALRTPPATDSFVVCVYGVTSDLFSFPPSEGHQPESSSLEGAGVILRLLPTATGRELIQSCYQKFLKSKSPIVTEGGSSSFMLDLDSQGIVVDQLVHRKRLELRIAMGDGMPNCSLPRLNLDGAPLRMHPLFHCPFSVHIVQSRTVTLIEGGDLITEQEEGSNKTSKSCEEMSTVVDMIGSLCPPIRRNTCSSQPLSSGVVATRKEMDPISSITGSKEAKNVQQVESPGDALLFRDTRDAAKVVVDPVLQHSLVVASNATETSASTRQILLDRKDRRKQQEDQKRIQIEIDARRIANIAAIEARRNGDEAEAMKRAVAQESTRTEKQHQLMNKDQMRLARLKNRDKVVHDEQLNHLLRVEHPHLMAKAKLQFELEHHRNMMVTVPSHQQNHSSPPRVIVEAPLTHQPLKGAHIFDSSPFLQEGLQRLDVALESAKNVTLDMILHERDSLQEAQVATYHRSLIDRSLKQRIELKMERRRIVKEKQIADEILQMEEEKASEKAKQSVKMEAAEQIKRFYKKKREEEEAAQRFLQETLAMEECMERQRRALELPRVIRQPKF